MAQPTRTVQLRGGHTGFAADIAARLERDDDGAMVRIITESQAVEPMRRILSRFGLETRQAIRQGDGRMTPTWYEAPELWIKRWAGSESAIILKEDATGPLELRFVRRLAVDTVTTTMRLGDAKSVSRALLRAAWDLGIRRITAEIGPAVRAAVVTEDRKALTASLGTLVEVTLDDHDQGTEQTHVLKRRP